MDMATADIAAATAIVAGTATAADMREVVEATAEHTAADIVEGTQAEYTPAITEVRSAVASAAALVVRPGPVGSTAASAADSMAVAEPTAAVIARVS